MKIKTYTKKDIATEFSHRNNQSIRKSIEATDTFNILKDILIEDRPYTRIELEISGFSNQNLQRQNLELESITNEEIYVPAHKKTRFKPGKLIKAHLRKPI